MKNWYYKVRQLLLIETENSYLKVNSYHEVITNCGRSLLESAAGNAKCDIYYEVRIALGVQYTLLIKKYVAGSSLLGCESVQRQVHSFFVYSKISLCKKLDPSLPKT